MSGSWESMHHDAPPGAAWVCAACGKIAQDRRGGAGKADRGWDESCFLHATLVDSASIELDPATGRAKKATAYVGNAAPQIDSPSVADLAARTGRQS